MIPELGHYALMLALGLALIQAIMPIVGTRTGDAVLMYIATPTAWTILLAILTFSLSLIGTFLVRSGVLTSVHAFATDPMRGVFILAILVIFIGGGLALYGWRAPLLKQGGLFAPISREGALVFNNLFLTTACATVFVGTLYPLALEVLVGAKISVGPPFFNATFVPLFIALMVVIPFGPLLGWKRGDLLGVAQRLLAAAILAALAIAAAFALEQGGPSWRRSARASPSSSWPVQSPTLRSVRRFCVCPCARRCSAPSGCRVQPGAPHLRISASASRCLASSP